MRRLFLLLSVGLFAVMGVARAHGPQGAASSGAHGGDIVDVEGGHIELVVSPKEMVIYLTDPKNAPLASAGVTARAIVQDGATQAVVPLLPREPNVLAAPLAAPLNKDAKIAVSTTLAKDGKPVQARFVIK